MTSFALGLAALLLGGLGALLAGARPRLASHLGAGGAVLGSSLGLVPAIAALLGHGAPALMLPWHVPGGVVSLAIDPLSAFFLVPVFVVGSATALYGHGYLLPESRHKLLGAAWLWFDLLLASMALVATAQNGLLFLMAWEAMALTSFFLVVFHHERDGVPEAGWIYLVAAHLGTAFLLVLFAWLGHDAGSLEFARWAPPATGVGWLFALALVGFGSKAGLFPFHVWLPEAHPAAPSHVSALLSGVMIKLGLYGLLRMVVVLGPPPAAASVVLVAVALVSAIFGVLLALGQHDLKRLLAYHSVENVGIIALGLGLGGLAASEGHPGLAALALAGGLLHVWNHALFKSLLFLGAGAVGRSVGTFDLEQLGGLLRRMPWTGATFLLAAAAICALPPLNGFVSEFLVYAAAFQGIASSTTASAVVFGAAIAGLALIGGLAAACFVKATGTAFLGEPRSRAAADAAEVAATMRGAMLALAAGCVVLGVAGPMGVAAALRPAGQLLSAPGEVEAALGSMVPVLWTIGACGAGFAVLAIALAGLRRRVLRGRRAALVETWGCGFAETTPRMQYTASSFAEPLTRLFAPVLRTRVDATLPDGPFPGPASLASHASDLADGVFRRVFRAVARLARAIRPLESGSTQVYVFYTISAALGLLFWRLL